MRRKIILAHKIFTMNDQQPIAEAVVTENDRIAFVGSAEEALRLFPDTEKIHLGEHVLLPGFIDSHSHPALSGLCTMPPAIHIAPWVVPSWDAVLELFKEKAAQGNEPLIFFGLDQMLHQCHAPTTKDLDAIFGDRFVGVVNNSGHAAYVTTAVLKELGWDNKPPIQIEGGYYGADENGIMNGQAFEVVACLPILAPILSKLQKRPLMQVAEYYALMAQHGITTTTEMAFDKELKSIYEKLSHAPDCPLRIFLYHLGTNEEEANAPMTLDSDPMMLDRIGIKLYSNGSPWVGNIYLSFPYLDNPSLKQAQLVKNAGNVMNYPKEDLQRLVDLYASKGWQLAVHANGDKAVDVVLEIYESALKKHNLLGTDHRFRIEHAGAARSKQFKKGEELGVVFSLAAFHFCYWGDLLDGTMFDSKYGAHWQPFNEAFECNIHPSLHNDGSVSPPNPLLNIQACITRRTISGTLHGPEHKISLDQAFKGYTLNAAYALFKENEIGSIEVGKKADFVRLSCDPYQACPETIATDVKIIETWRDGKPMDLSLFLSEVQTLQSSEAENQLIHKKKTCCS